MRARRGDAWAAEFGDRRASNLQVTAAHELDRVILLRAIDRYWGEIFSGEKLHREHRSIVNELITVRNDFVHDKPFNSSKTLRALDSVARLLDGISAKREAGEVWRSYDDMLPLAAMERNVPPPAGLLVPASTFRPSNERSPEISAPVGGTEIPRTDEANAKGSSPTIDARTKSATCFYDLIDRLLEALDGGRGLENSSGQMDWPAQGVYFVFEPGEHRSRGKSVPRVVRVGTHAVSGKSKTTMWTRLRMHRGTASGNGHQRASIFRHHVGTALIRRHPEKFPVQTWDDRSLPVGLNRELETQLEHAVSNYIKRMSLVWISVPGPAGIGNDRDYLERNSVALLSSAALEQPSLGWLGRDSDHEVIRSSGLWNVDNVGAAVHPDFLERFEHYVVMTVGRC
jgi:hypothetical protein